MTRDLFRITAGFLPLLDSALLVVARERGFARDQGIELILERETSWASMRDRLAVAHFDVAHMLAPMPIASNLGVTSLPVPMVAAMALGLGGNAITVSAALWKALRSAGAPQDLDPHGMGEALSHVVKQRASKGNARLRFAVVHPHSGHNFELRYWLAACGVRPEVDVDIAIVPPPLMPDALMARTIDGFCVGEPWNTVAVRSGEGRIVTAKSLIWRSSPEKVLVAPCRWAETHEHQLGALVRAVHAAAEWCEEEQHRDELAALLAGEAYLNVPVDSLLPALSGWIQPDQHDGATVQVPDFFVPARRAATFPWQSHALWFYSQMVRWEQVTHSRESADVALRSYRPDIYRAALSGTGVPLPGASAKVEGALSEPTAVGASPGTLELGPDGFFDGEIFDPDNLEAYLAQQRSGFAGGP